MSFSVLCLLCLCVCLFVPCGHLLGKGWPLGSQYSSIQISYEEFNIILKGGT